MRFVPLNIAGAFAVELEPHKDHRGFFARSYCEREFREHGLMPVGVQCNISYNAKRGTLRGIHFQNEPHPEAKLIRCTRGAAFDVVVDLRPESPTYRQWASLEITAENRVAMYAPVGCGHGFQTLSDDTELFYHMGEEFYPGLSGGVHWSDPSIGISWPILPPILSERDDAYPKLAS